MSSQTPASGLPLAGAVLCCTSIAPEQRTKLAGIGSQMGATVKLDLTSDVTHLIVGSIDSAKYRYVAKAREDVKVLPPAWLDAMRDQWMTGEDNLDVAALEEKYRLPAFFGLKICLTGFDNPDQRRHIQETVHANGAEYHGDLTKAVTHLIAATPAGKKYEHAFNWGIKIVSLEWFEQSLERGMALFESLYDPRLPIDERGKDAWERRQSSSPTLGKRARNEEQGLAVGLHRRKLRRSASTKMGNQSEALWANITAPVQNRTGVEDDEWTEEHAAVTNRESQADASKAEKNLEKTSLATSGTRDALSGQLPPSLAATSNRAIFKGHIIIIYGFDSDKTTILHQHLESNGALVVRAESVSSLSDHDLSRTFMVVPHDAEVDITFLPDHVRSLLRLVSNWWVERCLYGKRLLNPSSDPLSKPLGTISIPGFTELTINSTGFSGIELLHITKLISLMGGTYDEQLTPKTLLIICSSHTPNQAKLKFATDRKIAVVHVDWLYVCIRTGSLSPIGDFQLNKLIQNTTLDMRPKSLVQHASGKGFVPREDDTKPLQTIARQIDNGGKITARQQSYTLDLVPSAGPAPTSPPKPRHQPNSTLHGPGVGHEEFANGGLDGHDSLPLQDVDPNSPQRRSTLHANSEFPSVENSNHDRSSSAESLIKPIPTKAMSKAAKQNTETSVLASTSSTMTTLSHSAALSHPTKDVEEEKDYSDLLAQLRANRKAAPSPVEQCDNKRRRGRRQLGRALSTRSNQSTAESSGNFALEGDDDEKPTVIPEYQPSQELGWDSPGAAKAREQMIKRLGGKVPENSVPVQGIGVVKDALSETTGRAGRRRRK